MLAITRGELFKAYMGDRHADAENDIYAFADLMQSEEWLLDQRFDAVYAMLSDLYRALDYTADQAERLAVMTVQLYVQELEA